MKLVELLNLCQLSNRSGTIRYNRDGEQGLIHIRDGHALHAEFNNLEGEEALYIMLENDSGIAVYDAKSEIAPATIFKSAEHVLLEAARRADEKIKTVRINLKKTEIANGYVPSGNFLLLCQVGDEEKSFLLKSEGTYVGKTSNNDIILENESVSRRHCLFEIKAGRIVELSDLGSLNGTYVNGKRVEKAVKLNDGDGIHIGPIPARFYIQK
jgi:hypothetical protein